MTAALAIAEPHNTDLRTARDAFEPANFQQAIGLAASLAKSGLMPRALGTPEAIVTAIVMGRELGMTAMQSVRSIHVIEGKPAMSSALIVALCKRETRVCRYFRMVESTDEIATYETLRVGEPEPTRMSFTIAQARAAQVTGKDNWKKFPAAMLRARCETALARAVYPDLVMGLYDPDELAAEPPRDVTPIRQVRATVDTRPPPVEAPVEEAEVVNVGAAAIALVERFNEAATADDLPAINADVKAGLESGVITPEEKPLVTAAYKAAKARVSP